jgi:hypothetical protein
VGFALPLGNGLIVSKVMECKKLLVIKLTAKIQMHDEPVSQPVFHKAESAKCALVLTKLRTWTVVIFGSFTYFESFWLSVGDTVILHQSQVIGFKLFSESCMTTSKLWIVVILKWERCKSKL